MSLASTISCGGCGKSIPVHARFCGYCGTRVHTAVPLPPEKPSRHVSSVAEPISEERIDLRPGTVVGNYEIVSELGHGGMAYVYKARHRILDHWCALKVLDPVLVREPDMRERFLQEGRIQSRLRHPSIVAVTDVVVAPGVAGLVAEFVDGPSLAELIESRRSSHGTEEARAIFLPILDALSYAHREGVIHRDIKPENILLERTNTSGRWILPGSSPGFGYLPKLADFGIAKVMEQLGGAAKKGVTRLGARLGTVNYMSPEQIRSPRDVDASSDLFSLAATLYEFVTGEVPFRADSEYDTQRMIVDGAFRPPRELRRDLDPVLEECIVKGLAPDRSGRFQDADSFTRALSQSDPFSRGVQVAAAANGGSPDPAEPAKTAGRWGAKAATAVGVAAVVAGALATEWRKKR